MKPAEAMIQILREMSLLIVVDDKSPKKALAQIQDYYLAEPLVKLETLAKKLAPKMDRHFGSYEVTGENTVKMTKVGQELVQTMREIMDVYKKYPTHQLNPFVQVFMDCLKRTGMYYPEYFRSPYRSLPFPDNAEEILNKFVYDMRVRLNETEFKQLERKHRRTVKQNLAGLNSYINGLFVHYPKMRVVRIDLAYLNTCSKDYKTARDSETLNIVEYSDVRRHREKLVSSLGDSLVKDDLVGYAWTLKNSLVGGYCIHLMVFLDASTVDFTQERDKVSFTPNEGDAIANKIGEKWMKITTNLGLFYNNVQGVKPSFRSCGTGLVSADDKNARHLLRRAAEYMLKSDLYIKYVIRKDIAQSTKVPEVEVKNNDRTFGKGSLPKEGKSKSKAKS
ncbi:MAG: hypothetical protein NVSMB40_11400 [Aquirhabdus sp.]